MTTALTALKKKWPEYLLEILVIMLGILGAFLLNNWSEEKKLEVKRQELISSLIEDFDYNLETIKEKIETSKSRLTQMDDFYSIIQTDNHQIPVDSLKSMARVFFRFESFNPNLTTYRTAESTGTLELINNANLLQEFTAFLESFELYSMVNRLSADAFFSGSLWELRKSVKPGSIYKSIYSGSTATELPFKEYQKLMSTSLAQNALQNAFIMEGNSLEKFQEMKNHGAIILSLLQGL